MLYAALKRHSSTCAPICHLCATFALERGFSIRAPIFPWRRTVKIPTSRAQTAREMGHPLVAVHVGRIKAFSFVPGGNAKGAMVEGAGTGGPLLQYSVPGTQYSVRRTSEFGASNAEFDFSDIESKVKTWRADTAWPPDGHGCMYYTLARRPSPQAGGTP